MGTGEDRQADGVGVLLQDGLGHLLRGLEQAGVDHLEAGVAQRPSDDLDPSIVAVEAGFGHDDSIRALHAGHPREVPVSRSDPRRATIVGVVGVVVGVILVCVVLLVNASGRSSHTTTNHSEIKLGAAVDRAKDAATAPLLVPDTANGSRPFYVTHGGDDPASGWTAFDALVEGCHDAVSWDATAGHFTDCHGATIPSDGGAQQHYLTTVDKDGQLVVNVNPEALTSTTVGSTTSSIVISGG